MSFAKFVTLLVRAERRNPNKPDQVVSDFEETVINLAHVTAIQTGPGEDSCLMTLAGVAKPILVKGSLEDLHAFCDERLSPA
jgi:hypothetical protein